MRALLSGLDQTAYDMRLDVVDSSLKRQLHQNVTNANKFKIRNPKCKCRI